MNGNGTGGVPGKPKFAMYWAASCGGCDIAVLNIGPKILDVDAAFDIVFWPVAMDGKYTDVEALPDGSIALTFFSGSIRNSENEELAHLLRRKSKILVAFGSCACEGCIPGLANLSSVEEIFSASYESPGTDNPDHVRPQPTWQAPEGVLELPVFRPVLSTLDQVVPVDYYLPGCPPESHQIAAVVELAIKALTGEAELPARGSTVGAGVSTVCDECARQRGIKKIRRFARPQELAAIDPQLCLLEQGIPCNGSATRDGCGALCPAAGAQCIGCYGPAEGVLDYGARLMSAFASVIDATDVADIERVLDTLPDPVGQFYRFSLPSSLLRAGRPAWQSQPAVRSADRAGEQPAAVR
ncbi:MAG TPA: F420-nonreducing hydrogenase [Candidatus Limnocylindrales bacterium]